MRDQIAMHCAIVSREHRKKLWWARKDRTTRARPKRIWEGEHQQKSQHRDQSNIHFVKDPPLFFFWYIVKEVSIFGVQATSHEFFDMLSRFLRHLVQGELVRIVFDVLMFRHPWK